jgi:hypothetical protein
MLKKDRSCKVNSVTSLDFLDAESSHLNVNLLSELDADRASFFLAHKCTEVHAAIASLAVNTEEEF